MSKPCLESKFSRAIAEFAASKLPQQLHAAVIATTQQERLIGHVARDSTAILARERFPERAKQKKKARQAKKKKPAQHSFRKKIGSEHGTRIQRQRKQKMDTAYDADEIHAPSRQLNQVPIIAPHPRRGTKKISQLPKIFPAKPTPGINLSATGPLPPADHALSEATLKETSAMQES